MRILSRIFGKKAETAPLRHGGGDMVSLVALTPGWEPRSVDSVRRDLDELFPGEFLPPREEGNFILEGPVPDASYMVQCVVPGHGGVFLIHNVPGPYSDFSDFLSFMDDPELKALAAKQPCWMSVDLMHSYTTAEEGLRFITVVIAKLAPADVVLLVHPSRYMVALFTPELRAVLASGGVPFGTS
jgi:hypothetical protein